MSFCAKWIGNSAIKREFHKENETAMLVTTRARGPERYRDVLTPKTNEGTKPEQRTKPERTKHERTQNRNYTPVLTCLFFLVYTV